MQLARVGAHAALLVKEEAAGFVFAARLGAYPSPPPAPTVRTCIGRYHVSVADGNHGEAAPAGHLVAPPREFPEGSGTQRHVAALAGSTAEGGVLEMQKRPNVKWG